MLISTKKKAVITAADVAARMGIQDKPLPGKTAMERLGGRKPLPEGGGHTKGQWLAHDRATGSAAARRRRQMERGILPRMCTSCGMKPVATVHVDLCDECLERQFA